MQAVEVLEGERYKGVEGARWVLELGMSERGRVWCPLALRRFSSSFYFGPIQAPSWNYIVSLRYGFRISCVHVCLVQFASRQGA